MSLVDYAASSDEDEPQEQLNEHLKERRRFEVSEESPSTSALPLLKDDAVHPLNKISMNLEPLSSKQKEIVSDQSPQLKLPDASFLLNSPVLPSNQLNPSDHSSRVAAAMAESVARKRDLSGASANLPRSKVPKGTLARSKNIPETVGGHLLPPQLSGRSNVVTEDINKLFLKKNTRSPAD